MAIFTNQATLSYNNTVTTSNITTGEILDVLAITKTSLEGDYTTGGEVTYVVSIVNSGTAAFTGLTVTDDLGSYTEGELTLVPLEYIAGSAAYYINGVQQAAPTAQAGPPLTFSGINVPAGGNALIIYKARVNSFAPPEAGSTIVNTVSATGGGLSSAVTAEATTAVSAEPELTITKSLSPASVPENGRITYTFNIINTGSASADAGDLAVITDIFDPILSDIAVTFNGTAWSSPANYTYNTSTGLFSTVAGQITVPAATYTRNEATGEWVTTPGVSTLVVTGTV